MKLAKLFEVEYPPTLVFAEQHVDLNGINFVSSSGKNNGIVSRVKPIQQNKLFEKGSITVPLKGTVLKAFVQPEDFYVAHQIAVLIPRKPMSLVEKLFYCLCIRKNRYRFNYGRQADRTLKSLELPNKIPSWIYKKNADDIPEIKESIIRKSIKLDITKWKEFSYDYLFEVKKGKRVIVDEVLDEHGKYNFVSAIKNDNGVFGKINLEPNHTPNVITVNYDGQGGVAEAFYQDESFWALDSVNVLYPKFNLNPFIAMFLITLIRKERYRFNYGRKWHKERMEKSIIKLPVDHNDKPDWKFMEEYIKSLPYSKTLK